MSNAAFVTSNYQLVLNRTPSAGEVQGWVNALNNGTSRSSVALGFTTSTEATVDDIGRFYTNILHRQGSAGELQNWANVVQSGQSLQKVEGTILGSPEAQNVAGNDLHQFIKMSYQDILNRTPGTTEMLSWEGGVVPGANGVVQSILNANTTHVDQFVIGDCMFEAAVDSLMSTATGVAALQNDLSINADGSYTVSLSPLNKPAQQVTITPDQVNAYSILLNNTGPEAQVFESAFLQYEGLSPTTLANNPTIRANPWSGGSGSGTDVLSYVGSLQLLTGTTEDISFIGPKKDITTTSQLDNLVTGTLAKNQFITAASISQSVTPGLVANHDYTVLGTTTIGGVQEVELRNPWGTNPSTTPSNGITYGSDGNLLVPETVFLQNFDYVEYTAVAAGPNLPTSGGGSVPTAPINGRSHIHPVRDSAGFRAHDSQTHTTAAHLAGSSGIATAAHVAASTGISTAALTHFDVNLVVQNLSSFGSAQHDGAQISAPVQTAHQQTATNIIAAISHMHA